jgi:DNA mismatch endonuclease (patch repair protein)
MTTNNHELKHYIRPKEITSKIMSRIRSSGSKAEVSLGKAMWNLGLRYRKQYKKLKGRPDYVFVSAKVAVFCDGDFWHGRDFVERLRKGRFKSNKDYWVSKITRNMQRDKEVTQNLIKQGWDVLRFWESDILKDANRIALKVKKIVHEQSQ